MRLFEEICSYNNLLLAFDKVEENEGTYGIDSVTIEEFSVGVEKKLSELRKDLINGTYFPLPLRKVGIPKPNGKIRWLSIPCVKDRVIQTSALMVLSPILDKEFEECSFAYRKERSVQKAIQKIIDLRDMGYVWVVDADISSFFDEIDHEILVEEVRKYINDDRVTDLITKWLSVDVVYKGARSRLTKGVPQGSPISPLLSNLYLDSFDEALMEERFKHIRFADDFVVLCKDKPEAEDALELTEEVLKKLRLQLNMEKTRIVHFNHGFRYLGVEFLRSMVYRPIYEETDIEQASDIYTGNSKGPHSVIKLSTMVQKEISSKEKGFLSDMPKTVMANAFKKAFIESERDDMDFLFEKKEEIEPTAFGDPFLRTLYLLEQGTTLKKENERFIILKDKEVIKEIPAIKVDQILIFGNIQVSTQAMKFCLEENIPIILLSSRGKYFGTVESFKRTNVELHKKQFEKADDKKFTLEIGKATVRAKINNSKVLIQRYARKRPRIAIDAEIKSMNILLEKLSSVSINDELIGIEGAASARYFSAFRTLIGNQWGFKRRQKQPPPDPVNSLLSYGYTLMFYNIYAIIRIHGLHPYVGFLHGIRQGHPSLVSDLMEEFRAPVVDAVVLNLILRGSLKKDDFLIPEDEGSLCLLKDEARKVFVKAFEGKMNSSISHGGTGYQVDYRRCIDLQVQALRRVIEGKSNTYEPMIIK
ncbi:MAG: group II intron reverse transcriptase/maturase [Nitrospirota bacterium]